LGAAPCEGLVLELFSLCRIPDDVMAPQATGTPKEAPRAKDKWVTASVADDAASVIARVFDEAERRDPNHGHPWVALVDGNNHQIDRIEAEAGARDIEVTVLVDFIHVLKYLWKAVWCFFVEGDPAAEGRTGCTTRLSRCGRAGHESWPRLFAAKPPPFGLPSPPARTLTRAPTTCSPRPSTSITRPPC